MQVVERRLEQAAEVGTGDARGVIDAYMQVLPAHATGVGLAGSIAGDAVSGADKPPELLDVQMNHVARVIVYIPVGERTSHYLFRAGTHAGNGGGLCGRVSVVRPGSPTLQHHLDPPLTAQRRQFSVLVNVHLNLLSYRVAV